MKIGGLQKLSLLDFPEKTACIVFTEGCNLRCPFCHNASLVTRGGDFVTEDELFTLLTRRKGVLDGVVITGGEPLLHKDLMDLIIKIKEKGYLVKLDTNGCFPDRLNEIIESGLIDYVAMDVKNSPDKYAQTVGIKDFDVQPVKDSVQLLKRGKVDYEFRTTVVKPFFDETDFMKIGEWIKGANKYYLQKFKDSGDLISPDGLGEYTPDEMQNFLKIAQSFVPSSKIRG